jgi:RNA polymerase sigma factor (sigma-70 family)
MNGEHRVSGSTTHWLLELQAGNRQAAQELWERYYRRLVGFARKKLNGRRVGAADDENDIALSAFASFYQAAEEGRFPRLSGSNDLWRLLIVITQRKINHRLRHDNCQKRRSVYSNNGDLASIDLAEIASSEPSPEFYVLAIESFRDLLNRLGKPTLQRVALMKMEGYTNEEISSDLGCSLSTVERKLRRIRHEWSDAIEGSVEPDQ